MTNMSSPGSTSMGMTSLQPSQIIVLIVGLLFTLTALAGFAITGFSDFANAQTQDEVLGFAVNPMHNLVHLLIGIGGLVMCRTVQQAKAFGWVLFAFYGTAFVYGLFVVNSAGAANFLALNSADNGLHLASALIGLAAALIPNTSGMRRY